MEDFQFPNNNTGGSLVETYLFMELPVVFNIATILILRYFNYAIEENSYTNSSILIEFVGIIVPLVLFLTILHDYVYVFYSCIVLPAALFTLFVLCKKGSMAKWKSKLQVDAGSSIVASNKLPCISHFRGVINLYSAICILGADFSCFPKRFLKTDSFGYSLMDTGVGLYVAALGISTRRRREISFISTILYSARKVLPLFFLGVGRYVSILWLQYPHNESEYGTHWNFFITLSIVASFNDLLLHFMRDDKYIGYFALALLLSYEAILNTGLSNWIISDNTPRNTFVSANREGLFSSIGFEVIFLFCYLIKNALPKQGDSLYKYVNVLKKYSLYWIAFLALTVLADRLFGVSRKCANSGYIFWITGVTMTNLILLISFELLLFVSTNTKAEKMAINENASVPVIIDSINFNGLLFFLTANLLTGGINMSFDTLRFNRFESVLIIIAYISFCCSLSFILYLNKRRVR